MVEHGEPAEGQDPAEPAARVAGLAAAAPLSQHGEAGAAELAATVERLSAEIRTLGQDTELRALVELAKGVLVERLNCGPAEASRQLQRLAAESHVALPELAADIVNQAAGDAITHAVAEARAADTVPRAEQETSEAAAQPGTSSLRLRTAEAAVSAGDDAQTLAGAVLDHGLSPLGATAAAVWAPAPDGSLTLAGEAGFGPAEAARWRYVPPGVGAPAQRAVAEDRTLWVSETSDAPAPTIGRGLGGTIAVLPVHVGGRRVGALEIRWPDPGPGIPPTPALLRQLEALAQLCALSLSSRGTEPDAPPGGPAVWLTGLVDGLLDSGALLRPLRNRDGRITDFLIEHTNERFTDPVGRPRGSLTGLPLLEAYPLFALEGGLFEQIKRVHATGISLRNEKMALRFPAEPTPKAVLAAVGLGRFGDTVLLTWRFQEGDTRLADLLQHVQRLSLIGGFEENLTTSEIVWTDQLRALRGLPVGAEPIPLHHLGRHVHPDDTRAVGCFLRTVLHNQEESAVTFRLPRPDGVVRHLRLVAEPVCDASGHLVAVRGAYQDISPHRWTEVALAATRDRLVGAEQEAAERHRLARQLQRAIMPAADQPVHTAGLRVAVRYCPADEDQRVGGDWYDAVLLPGDRVLLTVGDVAGHGVSAATGMVVLRNALRGLAVTGAGPSRLLSWLNRLAQGLTEPVTATVVCGVFDPATRTLLWARAGHLPPVLVRQGTAELLPLPEGLMLGVVDNASYEESRLEMEPQDTLLMYTDGLIECRDSDVRHALGHLLTAAGRQVDDLDSYLGHLLSQDIADTDDDVCLIGVQAS
ncbi:SpoIIE family protein phosphatase [Nonomuraea phyllanthi]|uniref:SpoIIE family protein phosphatase n=1 Tax=Nonomuraea phyllanthi TaxID=2219224 RepID=UPI001293D769|nr:SpoIIE family protein phosphatase [Nonomuraea phyllanthi]QFY12121.1 SpoIIE family protein phosphatase [Nonomuraea phyllanthi]